MGYFPNGMSGAIYQEQYCVRCVHDKNNDCPIWLAHLLKNYDEHSKKDSLLHLFIPRDKDGENEQCKMFIEDK